MTGDGPFEQLSRLRRAAGTIDIGALTGGRPSALGWATVELDRAVVDLGAALRVPPEAFVEAAASLLLGASCRVVAGVLSDGIAVVVMEPNTEGRLASTLARRDEGPAAVWLAVDDLTLSVAAVEERGGHASQPLPGPFGDECLVLDGPIHGPHRLLVERPGTIRT